VRDTTELDGAYVARVGARGSLAGDVEKRKKLQRATRNRTWSLSRQRRLDDLGP